MHVFFFVLFFFFQAGFFKSQYKQLLENAEQSPEEGPTTK